MRLIALVGVSVSLLLSEPPPTRAQAGSLDVERFRKLRQKLYDRDSEIRWGAAKAFTELGSEIHLTVNSLRARVATDVDPKVRAQAAEALGNIGPSAHRAVPYLAKALQDPNAGVRREAALALH